MPPPVLLLHMQIELLATDDGGVARAHRNHQARSDGLDLMSLALKRHRRRLCLKKRSFFETFSQPFSDVLHYRSGPH
jgi:hypothetical protein